MMGLFVVVLALNGIPVHEWNGNFHGQAALFRMVILIPMNIWHF